MRNMIKIIVFYFISVLICIVGGKIFHYDYPYFSGQDNLYKAKKDSVIYLSDNSSDIPLFSLKEENSQITFNRVTYGKTDKNQQFCSTVTTNKERFVKFSIIRLLTLSDNIFLKFQKYDIAFPFHFFW